MGSGNRWFQPWCRLWPPAKRVQQVSAGGEALPSLGPGETLLGVGNGRSYGDCCLNEEGVLMDATSLDGILAFDTSRGVIRCEGGVLLSAILDRCVPSGWFLPVTPGTKLITVAGAIANDIHGKNHHQAGTFGRHVLRFGLLRSDGTLLECSPDENAPVFHATIGGLGLTGLILWVDLQMRPIKTRRIQVETFRFGGLKDFFSISAESDRTHEYTVAWIDCLAKGANLGRGWFMRGNHLSEGDRSLSQGRKNTFNFFLNPPFSLVNGLSLRAFNLLYYHRPVPKPGPVDYDPFFHPLDGILNWNRMYGPKGLFQFQCVVPPEDGEAVIAELLRQIGLLGQGSFLAVLKVFGEVESPGLLSFPRPGPTLAVDFPNRGRKTRSLMERLEAVAMEAGGALYPAKDACMSPETFEASYPKWRELEAQRDPAFCSDFWRRVTGIGSSHRQGVQ